MAKLPLIQGWAALYLAVIEAFSLALASAAPGAHPPPRLGQRADESRQLTFAAGDALFTMPFSGQDWLPLENDTSAETTTYQALHWSPDGQYLATVQDYDTVVLLSPNPSSARVIFTSSCRRPPTLSLHWTPTGDTLAIRERCELPLSDPPITQAIYRYRPQAAVPMQSSVALPNSLDSDLYISPDAAFVAYVQGSHIYRLDLGSEAPPVQLTQTAGEYGRSGSPLAWSPDSQKIAFYAGTYPFQQLNVMGADGSDRMVLTPAEDYQIYHSRLVWSPNSRYLAYYRPYNPPYSNQETIQVADVVTGNVATITAPGFYDALAWSPDSQQLFFASGDRFTRQYLFLWDRTSQRFTQLSDTPLAQVLDPIWEDSDWIALTALPPDNELANRQLYTLSLEPLSLQALSGPEEYVFPVTLQP